MTPAELRSLAALDAAYVAEKSGVLTEAGAPIPEPLRRLGALASAVAAMPESAHDDVAQSNDSAVRALDVAHGQIASLESRIRHVEYRALSLESCLTIARRALYGVSQSIELVNAELDGSPVPVAATVAVDPIVPAYQPPTEAQKAFRMPESPKWPASGLFHGLVLVNRSGTQAVFAEPIKGQFSVQMIGDHGDLAEPFSAIDSQYKPETWADAGTSTPSVAKYDAPKEKKPRASPKTKEDKGPAAPRTEPLPGMADVAPSLPKMSEFVPTDEQVAKWAAKVWPDVDISVSMLQKIRAAVDVFKTDKARAEQRHADPGTLFFYWVMRPDNRPKKED